ncbi:MAG TPA: SUF system Fe-S cluster assembly protein [Candidatus Competibacteraceae bacterium]|nr:SUF system Fe-S cluster assembly protein [Candidatus Competibacteraceae bacterium]MCP5134776.1 SUF system Fe-S cluster assembly protein [Gammaproteobacteria bacterium]HPF57706.1 SUF system Fe-S cluster assembly protein [Candidatus Competibacteraceae bacterium]HRY19487.1 SUF system Fe-S cluster assembly protein [Candidatus Competibacteraceae bacterium]
MTETHAVPAIPDADEMEARVIDAIKTVYDPEIPVNIYELGLIYGLDVDPLGDHADIKMTLTAPGCPVAGSMPEWVENAVRHVAGVESVNVQLVWEPPWTPELMSMRAKLELNML